MHAANSLINVEFTERQLWSRILREANEAAEQDAFLAPLIADIISSGDLSKAIIARIADVLSPPNAADSLRAALSALLVEDCRILAATSFDLVAVLDRDPATTKALHVLLHAKGFLALQTHRFAHWPG
jgi:serine O-acetyltransferase